MAIHPEYAEKILTGRKTIEFRKIRFATTVTHIVIYATRPVQRVVGFFKVLGVDLAAPPELWRRYQRVGGVGKASFEAYYQRRDRGVAIKVGEVVGLRKPRSLSSLRLSVAPPQSFRYLPPVALDALRAETPRIRP